MATIILLTFSNGFILLSVINLVVVASVIVSTQYKVVQQMNDKIDDSGCLKNISAKSAIICSHYCVGNCMCFGYNEHNICRLHEDCINTSLSRSETGWRYYRKEKGPISIDCQDWYHTKGATLSGIYTIHPIGHTAVQVDCDMDTEDGGWTVIVKRSDGSVDFARNWDAYKNGFGSTPTEYWIGNHLIHILTKYNSALYIVITDTNDINFYEMYDHFSVSDEEDGFRIFFGYAVGNLGNSMMSTEEKFQLNGSRFTTVDMDQDNFPDNCAVTYGSGGGWWYNSCYKAQLTGPYGTAEWAWPWYPVFVDGTSIKAVKMMIKRKVQ